MPWKGHTWWRWRRMRPSGRATVCQTTRRRKPSGGNEYLHILCIHRSGKNSVWLTNRVNGSGDAHSDPYKEPAKNGGRHWTGRGCDDSPSGEARHGWGEHCEPWQKLRSTRLNKIHDMNVLCSPTCVNSGIWKLHTCNLRINHLSLYVLYLLPSAEPDAPARRAPTIWPMDMIETAINFSFKSRTHSN